jgi:hypothetical protein
MNVAMGCGEEPQGDKRCKESGGPLPVPPINRNKHPTNTHRQRGEGLCCRTAHQPVQVTGVCPSSPLKNK